MSIQHENLIVSLSMVFWVFFWVQIRFYADNRGNKKLRFLAKSMVYVGVLIGLYCLHIVNS